MHRVTRSPESIQGCTDPNVIYHRQPFVGKSISKLQKSELNITVCVGTTAARNTSEIQGLDPGSKHRDPRIPASSSCLDTGVRGYSGHRGRLRLVCVSTAASPGSASGAFTAPWHNPHVLVCDGSSKNSFYLGAMSPECLSPGSKAQGVQLGSLLSRARAQQPPRAGTAYLSLCMSWQRLMSGTEITPQRLYWPSPMERETSSTPRTLPSLHKEREHQFPPKYRHLPDRAPVFCLSGPQPL